jgi:hypothetical protein
MKPLTAADLIIGNKYVPHSKSVYGSLEDSINWRNAKEANRPYLYYRGVYNEHHCFSFIIFDGGDYLLPSDVTPYVEVEGKKQTAMMELLTWVRKTLPMDLDTPQMIESRIEQALQMEREQIEQAYENGSDNENEYIFGKGLDTISAEQYYSKTFKK